MVNLFNMVKKVEPIKLISVNNHKYSNDILN